MKEASSSSAFLCANAFLERAMVLVQPLRF